MEHRVRKVENSELSLGNVLSQISVSRLWIFVLNLEKPSCKMYKSQDQYLGRGQTPEVRTSNNPSHLPGLAFSRSSRRE